VTLTHAVKGEVNVLHLCQRCAADRGIETTVSTPLKNMIADYLPAVQAQAVAAQVDSIRCAFCSMSLADFRESGRLGCASCYSTFDQSLRALLRRVHGNAKHAGRQYEAPPPDLLHAVTALGELRERLRRAISQEEFEQAAQLRDQIRGME
jgi:protein arginine kinase activator